MGMRLHTTPWARIATAGIILAGFVFCLAVDLPGYLSYDSVVQLLEGRTAQYANWHPAVMSWLLGLADAVVPGAGLFVVFDALLFFASLLGLLLIRPKPSWGACAVAALLVFSPQVLLYQGTVWKDVLFANAGVAGFACLALAAERWQDAKFRFGLISAGFALFALAALVRQNGAVVPLFGAIALGWIAASQTPSRPLARAALYGAGALLAAGLLAASAGLALATRTVGDSGPAVQLQLLQTYDVIGAVVEQPDLDLARIADDDPSLEKIIRTTGVRVWSPVRNDTLGNTKAVQAALDDADPETIAAQWHDLILHHPWLYLRVRADVFRWVFLTPDLELCVPYEVGVDGPPSVMVELGLKERTDARDAALDDYAHLFVGTPVLSHAVYAVLAFIALLILLRRRPAPDIAIAFMLLAALAFAASFFVISIACDYRYLYFLDLAAMVAIFYLALDVRSAWDTLKNSFPLPRRKR
jgi:hypothetical protein